uniref:Solute carrier family 35 member D2 n=1 Tax=Scophthalmus maximus TaxID=52904 RepID=A0A8D3BQK2_SCOMX
MHQAEDHSALLKLSSALLYAGSSFLITVLNKTVLTSFRFPSYLCVGIGQMITTVVVLYAAKKSKVVQFQDFDRSVLFKMFPLPLLYVGNHVTGLASTKKLSLPMFTVLRKFAILMTMILEVYILRENKKAGEEEEQKNIPKATCVQRRDHSVRCRGCCKFGPGLRRAGLHLHPAERRLHSGQRCVHQAETRH